MDQPQDTEMVPARAPKTNATRIPGQGWETHKDILHKLYIDENRTLNEIIDHMRKNHQFNAVKRQYVHRFQKWGWKKYHSSVSEKSAPSLDASGRGDVGQDEVDEPQRASVEVVQDPETHHGETTSIKDKDVLEGSSQHLQSMSSSSHGSLALPHHRRAFSPRPVQLSNDVPTHSEYVPKDLVGASSVPDQAKVQEFPEFRSQYSLGQAPTANSANRVRKSTEYYPSDDSEDASNPPRAKKAKTGPKNRALPCPFRKRNPQRFNVRDHYGCACNSFADFALLKRHIQRAHSSSVGLIFCMRCKTTFSSQRELRIHSTKLESCPIVLDDASRDPEDGITVEISHALQVRKQSENINTWESLWTLLFPDDTTIPSPLFEPVIESFEFETFLLAHIDYIARELGSELHAHGLSGDAQADIENLLRPALLQLSQAHRRIKREEILAQIDKK